MKGQTERQRAHDALLAVKPDSVVHEPCELCPPDQIKEVAQVADADRTYTEAEHLALAADAVKRETADLSEAKESAEAKVTELTTKVDVLESEKATLQSEKDEATKALEDYKAEVERAQEIEQAKDERVKAIKAANDSLPDAYFTDERIQRWAEMTEEAFAAFLEDIEPVAAGEGKRETAAFTEGDSPTSPAAPTVGRLFSARRGENKN